MDKSYFIGSWDKLPEVVIGTVLIYLLIIGYTRLFGLKSFSKMTSYDFAHTVALGSLLASTIVTGSPSLLIGAVALGVLFALNMLLSRLQLHSNQLEDLLENAPLLLMRNGTILHENLRKAAVSQDELMAKLREANVLRLSQVQAVVMEATGDVSVLHGESEPDDILLENIRDPR